MVIMTAGSIWLLFGLHFVLVNGHLFTFEYNQTCGASRAKGWAMEGSVQFTPGDLLLFQRKVVISTVQELCTVDLSRCPPEPLPSSPGSCYCKSRTDDKYDIHVAATTSEAQAGKTVQAIIPGHGVFRDIYAASVIGTLPSPSDTTSRVNVSYTLDSGAPVELLATQTVHVCPDTKFLIEICVHTGHPEAELTLIVGNKTAKITGGRCVPMTHKLTSGLARSMTFQYDEPKGCSQHSVIQFKDDMQACPILQTTTASIPTTTAASNQVDGICPDTPRTLTTLPGGTDVLMDNISFNKSWVIFQRRISDSDFYQSWAKYREGFGKLNESFWLGLDKLHGMCNTKTRCELLINLKYPNKPAEKDINQQPDGCYYARYSKFYIRSASDKFKLHVSGYSGTAGDSLVWIRRWKFNHDNMRFSTYDNDNDQWNPNKSCARRLNGAWWYNACSASSLNSYWRGYGKGSTNWVTLTGELHSVHFTEMKVRRLK